MKMYLVVSHTPSSKEPAGVFAMSALHDHRMAEPAFGLSTLSEYERRTIRDALRGYGYSEDAIAHYDGEDSESAVFSRRKDARAVAARMNESKWWDWRVLEVGEAAPRDVRPVLGWQIMADAADDGGFASAYNGNAKNSGYDMVPDFTHQAEPAFKTRKQARAALKEFCAGDDWYSIAPIYGAWRVDVTLNGDGEFGPKEYEGALRFRTKREAEKFGRNTYGGTGTGYEVVLHDRPVAEDQLYTPVPVE